jgi:hypothetical protein
MAKRKTTANNDQSWVLIDWINNTEPLYRRRTAMERAIARYLCRGTYTQAGGVRGFTHVADAAAADYARDMGINPRTITRATRLLAAKRLNRSFRQSATSCMRTNNVVRCGELAPEVAMELQSTKCRRPGKK